MQFGEKIRQLRTERGLTQRELGATVDVEFSYISKIENGKLDFGDYPSEALIHRLADALKTDEFELLFMAKKIPEIIRARFFERPDVFRKIAGMDDKSLDELMSSMEDG